MAPIEWKSCLEVSRVFTVAALMWFGFGPRDTAVLHQETIFGNKEIWVMWNLFPKSLLYNEMFQLQKLTSAGH